MTWTRCDENIFAQEFDPRKKWENGQVSKFGALRRPNVNGVLLLRGRRQHPHCRGRRVQPRDREDRGLRGAQAALPPRHQKSSGKKQDHSSNLNIVI